MYTNIIVSFNSWEKCTCQNILDVQTNKSCDKHCKESIARLSFTNRSKQWQNNYFKNEGEELGLDLKNNTTTASIKGRFVDLITSKGIIGIIVYNKVCIKDHNMLLFHQKYFDHLHTSVQVLCMRWCLQQARCFLWWLVMMKQSILFEVVRTTEW